MTSNDRQLAANMRNISNIKDIVNIIKVIVSVAYSLDSAICNNEGDYIVIYVSNGENNLRTEG